jgi:Glycosyl transferase family 2
MTSSALPAVTVLIPAYGSDERLLRTLDSLRRQQHPDVSIHLSFDHKPGYAPPPLPDLQGLRVTHQPRNLGWVAHVNALVDTLRTPYFMVLAHDDAISPEYLLRAVAALEHDPTAVVAHGIVRNFGLRSDTIETPSITGDRTQRIAEFLRLRPHVAELGWRGVVRRELLTRGLRLRTRRSDGQFSNTLWALELLFYGGALAIPTIAYEKYTEPDGLSRVFHRRTAAERSAMLADTVACLADAVAEHGLEPSDAEMAVVGWAEWLLWLQGNWNVLAEEPRSDARSLAELRPALAQFIANVALAGTAAPRRK